MFHFILLFIFTPLSPSSSRMHQHGLHNQIRSKENSTFLLPRFLWRATYWVISDPKTRSWTHIFLCNPFCIFGKYWAGESRKSPDNWSGALGGWPSVREASYLTSRPTKDLGTTLNSYDNCGDDTSHNRSHKGGLSKPTKVFGIHFKFVVQLYYSHCLLQKKKKTRYSEHSTTIQNQNDSQINIS